MVVLHDLVVTVPAGDRITACATGQDIVAGATIKDVIAFGTIEGIGNTTTAERIAEPRARDAFNIAHEIDAGRLAVLTFIHSTGKQINDDITALDVDIMIVSAVEPKAAVHRIVASQVIHNDQVIAIAAADVVIALPALKQIKTVAAVQGVIAGVAPKDVVA